MVIGFGGKQNEFRGEGRVKWNKKLLTTFMHRLAELNARKEREETKNQELKSVTVMPSNVKPTLSASLAED